MLILCITVIQLIVDTGGASVGAIVGGVVGASVVIIILVLGLVSLIVLVNLRHRPRKPNGMMY